MLYWGVIGLLVASFLVRERLHGLAYPPPWPDEGSFLWQALALKESGTLFAPELHPTRAVLWMPPGYMVISAAIFSVTGFSLEWARALSGLYLCLAVLCLAALIRDLRGRWGYLALLFVFLHSPIAALAGNTARMESLILFVATGSCLLLDRGYRAAGVSLLAIGPLIHPNGTFPLLGGALYCLLPLRGSFARLRPRRPELFVIAFAVLSWLAYAAYVASHWADWVHDIGFQLRWKELEAGGESGRLARLLWPGVPSAVLAMLAAGFGVARSPGPARALLILCAALCIQSVVVVGWLYDLYPLFMLLIAAILAAEAAGAWLVRRLRGSLDHADQGSKNLAAAGSGAAKFAAHHLASMLGLCLAVVGFCFVIRSDYVMRSVKLATTTTWPGSPRYMQAEDRTAIAEYLSGLASRAEPAIVNFVPESEALEFHELRGPQLRFRQQTFHFEKADVYVFHDSVWIPELVRNLTLAKLAFQHEISVPVDDWRLLHQRDRTERWRVYERSR